MGPRIFPGIDKKEWGGKRTVFIEFIYLLTDFYLTSHPDDPKPSFKTTCDLIGNACLSYFDLDEDFQLLKQNTAVQYHFTRDAWEKVKSLKINQIEALTDSNIYPTGRSTLYPAITEIIAQKLAKTVWDLLFPQ